MSGDFSPEQKRYLEGFTSGLQIARAGRGLGGKPAAPVPSGPDAEHIAAQDRTVAAGGKLNDQEKFKREEHPFDAYGRLQGAGGDERVRRSRPTISAGAITDCSTSRRRRIPTCAGCGSRTASSSTGSCRGLADLAERYGGGYSHVTTRANFQIREIEPKNAVALLEAIQDLGLVLARHRRRQHPQRHRHADRRHRSAGTDRHAALRARMALPHPQRARRSTACRANSMSRSTAPAPSRCWRIPTTSASRRSR